MDELWGVWVSIYRKNMTLLWQDLTAQQKYHRILKLISPHKGPIMWKTFPCHEVVMTDQKPICYPHVKTQLHQMSAPLMCWRFRMGGGGGGGGSYTRIRQIIMTWWKSFLHYWPFVRGIHQWIPLKLGQQYIALLFPLYLTIEKSSLIASNFQHHDAHLT